VCACPDHTYRGVKCKHIFAVEISFALHKEVVASTRHLTIEDRRSCIPEPYRYPGLSAASVVGILGEIIEQLALPILVFYSHITLRNTSINLKPGDCSLQSLIMRIPLLFTIR
jgi:hypothetical protein